MCERAGSRTGLGMARPGTVRPIGPEALVALLEGALDRVVLIDSRPFVDYNTSHILEAVNVNCSKLMKRRLQQDKVQIAELLQHSAKKKVSSGGGCGRVGAAPVWLEYGSDSERCVRLKYGAGQGTQDWSLCHKLYIKDGHNCRFKCCCDVFRVRRDRA